MRECRFQLQGNDLPQGQGWESMGTVLFDSPSESPGMVLFDSNHSTVAAYLYVGWKRDFDHPTTLFYVKNSWKLQKGFWSRAKIFAKDYITQYRGADSCDAATVLCIKFFVSWP